MSQSSFWVSVRTGQCTVKLNFPDGFREALQYFIEWIAKSQSWLLFICLFKECMQTMKDKCPPPMLFGTLWNVIGDWVDLELIWTFLGWEKFLTLPGVESLFIKRIEFDVCDINSYCKNYNIGAIWLCLIAIMLKFGQDDTCVMICHTERELLLMFSGISIQISHTF